MIMHQKTKINPIGTKIMFRRVVSLRYTLLDLFRYQFYLRCTIRYGWGSISFKNKEYELSLAVGFVARTTDDVSQVCKVKFVKAGGC